MNYIKIDSYPIEPKGNNNFQFITENGTVYNLSFLDITENISNEKTIQTRVMFFLLEILINGTKTFRRSKNHITDQKIMFTVLHFFEKNLNNTDAIFVSYYNEDNQGEKRRKHFISWAEEYKKQHADLEVIEHPTDKLMNMFIFSSNPEIEYLSTIFKHIN